MNLSSTLAEENDDMNDQMDDEDEEREYPEDVNVSQNLFGR
jgi:hypothetical protein